MKSSKLPLLALVAALAAPSARAQTNQQAPQIITLPSANKFTLPPSQQSTPAILPTPVPTPAPAPPPFVVTVPTPTPTPSVSRPLIAKPAPAPVSTPVPKPVQIAPRAVPSPEVPVPKPAPVPKAAPKPAPAAVPTPAPAPSTASTPQATASSVPAAPTASPSAVPAPAGNGSVPVLWVVGAALFGALASAAFLLRRRRPEDEPNARADRPVVPPRAEPPAPQVEPPAPRIQRPVAPRPRPPAPPPRTGVEIIFRPLRLGISDQEALLDYELVVTNHGLGAMEDIKALLGVISAQPTQDQLIAAFHASAPLTSGAPVFTLAVGASQSLSGRLTMRRETILPVAVGGRPMMVPIGLVNLRWRQGLSVRSLGEAHMIGPEGEGGKLRPIWLDRGPGMIAPLGARFYAPEQQKQALAS